MNYRALGASTFVLAVACGSGGGDTTAGGWEVTVDTVGDTVTVRTTAGSVWSDTTVLEPETTIGVLEGDDEYMFGDIEAFVVARDGGIYVLDSQVPVVRRYAPDGTYLGDVGREGGGPGEYKRPASLALLPDGRLLVRDPGNGRISVYGPDGEALTSWRLPSGGTFNTSRPMYVDTAGNAYTMVLMETGHVPWEWTYGLAHFTPTGEHTDTLRVPRWDFEPMVVTAQREGSSSSSGVPFTPRTIWTFSPLGYFVGGLTTSYRFDLFQSNGHVLRVERASWTPVPVLAAEKAERERSIIENFKQNYGSWRWNGPPIPDTKPPYRDLTVDDDGRIWVRLSQPAYASMTGAEAREEKARTDEPVRRFTEPTAFDVFEPGGRYLGVVRAPNDLSGSPEIRARGDYVWGVTRDDLGVARLVRYRMRPASVAE